MEMAAIYAILAIAMFFIGKAWKYKNESDILMDKIVDRVISDLEIINERRKKMEEYLE